MSTDERMHLTAIVVLAAALASTAAAATIMRQATTASYKLTLSVGPVEAMYTPAEVKAKHPTSGEVMLAGGSTSTGGMPMGGSMRDLSVHIHSRATGKVVTNAKPQ